ncbi:MAG TPA: ATP-dependent DNA helicase RecG, partial [Marmoricola sp.]|nr:ATP-dependent DNA helicase RecG [Marmoricola sp.]
WIHAPDDQRQLGAAKKRLKYDEAFVAQVVLAQRRRLMASQPAAPRTGGGNLLARFDSQLPFQLTTGQQVVGAQIEADLAREHPMHRLLQGEVGSGKTLVALRAMLRVVDSGAQSVLLAPTEVLAQQHHQSITGLLGGLARGGLLGGDPEGTRVALFTGSMGTPARRQTLADVASGEAGIVVGTHALLEDKVSFADLGLVVVDEQHRFGVEQRAALTAKSAQPPHVLVMTATPIPRTVAMTVFGDLDTSVLKELPAGRAEVQTSVVPTQAQPTWLDRAWERVGEEVARGRQAYVVCPRIGDEPPPEEGPELHSVEELADALAAGPLSHLRVGRLHGRMASEDKDATMSAFAAGEIDVLVSTTVIEVGVDVSNASIMVVMDAERFGVSQLHQLRGRIGRGQHPGLCLLVTGIEPTSPSMERLLAVAATRDGFALAEVDLKARREGDVLGTDQSGTRRQLQLLSVISPRDVEVIEEAREIATEFVAADPTLASWPPLADAVRKLEDRADYLEMG